MAGIERMEVMTARVPLERPVQLGALTIAQRDYVALRLILDDGAEGYAYGYDRGLPLFDIVARAAQAYLGQPAEDRNRLRRLALGPTPAPRAAMTRGMSLCDIALWDAWCQSVGLPLWAALGGARRRLPVMPVIGYGMTPERAASETAALAARGFQTIKCMIDGRDLAADRAVMEALASALPEGARFGIDAHWSWGSVDEALPWCRLAERLGAAFVEDPFAPTQVHAIAALAARLDVPLAVGEDVIDLAGFRDLAAAGGILRVDASVSGGISGAMEAIALARAFDRPVIPHVFPALHAQLGFACEAVRCVEMIMPEVGADPIDQFFLAPPHIGNGDMLAPQAPGAGLALDWERLAAHAIRKDSFA
ncbi:mandelate racemase/muconate lactonizing enzyme family protein [Devosia sp.]|uniref:mandelate racemase/muconate lactonizing enzyme family protein n=1 Tax=Devosia sp. TaxID=1871048 RepID=UPI002AFE5FB8|nr:enolase C-terminal domain-like protein [Devosia sp.]